MLVEKQLFETRDKVQEAIKILREFEPEEGYYLADSGGKDSDVILELARMSGVKFDAHHNLTTIDPPDVIYHIREFHKETVIHRPKVPLLDELTRRGFPMRMGRWCCGDYKERGGAGRFIITGVRGSESVKRSKRKMVEFCFKDSSKRYLNIIHNWTTDDVWDFHKKYNIPYCGLYDEGWERIGCLLCPLAKQNNRIKEAERYPKYVENFRKAFVKLYKNKKEQGKESVNRWGSGDEMFEWWLNGMESEQEDDDQTILFE